MKEKLQQQNKPSTLNNMLEMFKKNKIHYIIMLFGILFCLYTLLTVKSYEVECNNYWVKQINDSSCLSLCFQNINDGQPTYELYTEGIQYPILNGNIQWGAKER